MDYSKFNDICQYISNSCSDEDIDFSTELIDINEQTNKSRNWQARKQENVYLAKAYSQIDERKALNLLYCANRLGFDVDFDDKKHLADVSFCRLRLCPLCSWRKSMRLFSDNMRIVDYIDNNDVVVKKEYKRKYKVKSGYKTKTKVVEKTFKKHTINYILVTLTVRNCTADKLSSTIDDMFVSFHNLIRLEQFSEWLGYVKHFEVTHNTDIYKCRYLYFKDSNNPKRKLKKKVYVLDDCGNKIPNDCFDTYHPHIHLLVAVRQSYFKSKNYVSEDTLRELWADCLHITDEEYRKHLQVSIDACRGSSYQSVAEVSKYASKSVDYIIKQDWDLTIDTVRTLDTVLAGRRLVTYSGIFNVVKKILKINDVEKADLIHIEDDEQEQLPEDVAYKEYYWWHFGYGQYYKLK